MAIVIYIIIYIYIHVNIELIKKTYMIWTTFLGPQIIFIGGIPYFGGITSSRTNKNKSPTGLCEKNNLCTSPCEKQLGWSHLTFAQSCPSTLHHPLQFCGLSAPHPCWQLGPLNTPTKAVLFRSGKVILDNFTDGEKVRLLRSNVANPKINRTMP